MIDIELFFKGIFEYFLNHFVVIDLIIVSIAMVGFLIRYYPTIKTRVYDLLVMGLLAGSFPIGGIFIATAFYPEFTDELKNFRTPNFIFGFIYMVVIFIGIKEQFIKRNNAAHSI